MIFHHIHHKMPIYKDCTFFEVAVIGTGVFVVLMSTLPLATLLLFGYALIGVFLAVFSMTWITRLLLSQLQKLKYGKPYGYYQHLFLKRIADTQIGNTVFKPPFLTRQAKWSVRRMHHGY